MHILTSIFSSVLEECKSNTSQKIMKCVTHMARKSFLSFMANGWCIKEGHMTKSWPWVKATITDAMKVIFWLETYGVDILRSKCDVLWIIFVWWALSTGNILSTFKLFSQITNHSFYSTHTHTYIYIYIYKLIKGVRLLECALHKC